jgi:hypothetical protein
MKLSGSRALGLIFLWFAFSVCLGQQPETSDQKAIRVQSSLVLVDVITQDPQNGLPVRDFKKEDFQIYDNGHEVPIASFEAGARLDTRPVILWLVVLCNEQGKTGGSAQFVGKESLFRPALNDLDKRDTVGVAHWCDNGEARLDLSPTEDRDRPISALIETIKPIPFHAGRGPDNTNMIGEATFRRLVRLIIQDAQRRNPQPLPVVVFLDADYTGQPLSDLNELVDDFLETSGIVFGIKDDSFPGLPKLQHEQGQIMHYMADQTGGQFLAAPPAGYSAALEAILMQLHFRYELGFIPHAIDGKRHELKVRVANEAKDRYKGIRLRFRPEYIPLAEPPPWTR